MLSKFIKKKSDLIFTSLGRQMFKFGFTPNRVTLISIFFKILALIFFFNGFIFVGGLFALLEYLFDIFDGVIARTNNKITNFGAWWDFNSDQLLRCGYIIAVAYVGMIDYTLACIAIFSHYTGLVMSFTADWKKVEIIKWMPATFSFLFVIGALFHNLKLFIIVMVVLNFTSSLFNLIIILYNQRRRILK